MSSVLMKLELDIMQANELQQAIELAIEHSLPAIVIHPALYADATMHRLKRRGQFKLIIPVDWPKGGN